MSEFLFVAVQ